MIIRDEKFECVHFNTGGKKLSAEEIEEVKVYLRIKRFKNLTDKTEESRQRVMDSKITDRAII